jgi:beta-N-acetylglucosaminidase
VWYKIYRNGKYGYVCSAHIALGATTRTVSIPKTTSAPATSKPSAAKPTQAQVSQVVNKATGAINKMSASQFESYLTRQGFPEDYKKYLRTLHAQHPNWVFVAYNTGLKWNDVLKKETAKNVSLVHKSYPSSYRSSTYRSQVEPGWYNASSTIVAYYMDPRNFLNQDRIYMFEDLSYRPEYQTAAVVTKILAPSKLPKYGFTSKLFMAAGKANKVSPVFLAARARQETGGGSITINGSKYGGTVVYNPFNVGATGSDPATNGLRYAKSKGWTTQAKAVNGGAAYIASGYITKKQNSIYFQRFNVCNGLSNVGVHQYMTNIQAPYNEAYMTKTSYSQLGITNESLAFIIPIYKGMPSSTKLP